MKFAALISGGKDSCFSVMQCLAKGHEIVCLVNLTPPDKASNDIDSFMYQTVGHRNIEKLASCFNLPLFQSSIRGTNKSNALNYSKIDGDETEDLFYLLKEVQDKYPDIEAVSSGAILSNYQRTRVEDVCSRLNLCSLSYLWEGDQMQLLDAMISSGIKAIVIKTASLGLGYRHLGKTIKELRDEFVEYSQKYDLNVCGEGGEYETFVLDCPLFQKELIITQSCPSQCSNDDVWLLNFEVEAVRKDIILRGLSDWRPNLIAPFSSMCSKSLGAEANLPSNDQRYHFPTPQTQIAHKVKQIQVIEVILNIHDLSQPESIIKNIKNKLLSKSIEEEDVVFTFAALPNMALFTKINNIYSKMFNFTVPPSRVCVSFNLDVIKLRLVCFKNYKKTRSGLYVRSISFWAPANIGPYSQITDVAETFFVSGQIGLVPATMQIPADTSEQLLQSLQNLYMVTKARRNPIFSSIIAYYTDNVVPKAIIAAWKWFVRELKIATTTLFLIRCKELPREANYEWHCICQEENPSLNVYTTAKALNTNNSMNDLSIAESLLVGFQTESVAVYNSLLTVSSIIDEDMKEYAYLLVTTE